MEQTVLRSHDPTQQMEPIDPSRSDLLQQIHAYQDELTTSPSSHDALKIALEVQRILSPNSQDQNASSDSTAFNLQFNQQEVHRS